MCNRQTAGGLGSNPRYSTIIVPSSNGRTADFDSAYRGSNPWGTTKKKEKMLGSRKISHYLCNQIEGSSLTSWKICSRGATVSARCLYHRGYRFESCREYTFRNKTTDSVPYTMRNGVMSVWERTLVYRDNTRASQPDLVRTNDYS